MAGPEKVAELTGRKGRVVRKVAGAAESKAGDNEGTTETFEYEKRNAGLGMNLDQVNMYEKEMFNGGDKRVAVISDAASSGISLHAHKNAKNQQRRVHITLELPWSADKARDDRQRGAHCMNAPP